MASISLVTVAPEIPSAYRRRRGADINLGPMASPRATLGVPRLAIVGLIVGSQTESTQTRDPCRNTIGAGLPDPRVAAVEEDELRSGWPR